MEPTALTDGERWVREELGALRASRFTPAAVARFLGRSQRRANAIRAERPELARREAAWLLSGAVAYVVVPAERADRAGALGWWLATGLMVDWHLGMVETADGRPRNLGPADALTLGRCWLVPLAWRQPTPWVVLGGWASDVLDGAAARSAALGGEPTRAGRDLEALADACFGLAVLRGLVRDGRLGTGAAAAEATRVAAGTAYAVAATFAGAAPPDAAALRAARATTVVRAAAMGAAAAGRRPLADRLMTAGTVASVLLAGIAAARPR